MKIETFVICKTVFHKTALLLLCIAANPPSLSCCGKPKVTCVMQRTEGSTRYILIACEGQSEFEKITLDEHSSFAQTLQELKKKYNFSSLCMVDFDEESD